MRFGLLLAATISLTLGACSSKYEPPPPCEPSGAEYCVAIEDGGHPNCPFCGTGTNGAAYVMKNNSTTRDIALTYSMFKKSLSGELTADGVYTAVLPKGGKVFALPPNGCKFSALTCSPISGITTSAEERVLNVSSACFVGDVCPHAFALPPSKTAVAEVTSGGCALACDNGSASCRVMTVKQGTSKDLDSFVSNVIASSPNLKADLGALARAFAGPLSESCSGPRDVRVAPVPGSFESIGKSCTFGFDLGSDAFTLQDGSKRSVKQIHVAVPTTLAGTFARINMGPQKLQHRFSLIGEGGATAKTFAFQYLLADPSGTSNFETDILSSVFVDATPSGSGARNVTLEGNRFVCLRLNMP